MSCSEWTAGVTGLFGVPRSGVHSSKGQLERAYISKGNYYPKSTYCWLPCGPLLGKVCHRHKSLTTMYIIKIPHMMLLLFKEFIKNKIHPQNIFLPSPYVICFCAQGRMLPQSLHTTMLLLNWKLRLHLAIPNSLSTGYTSTMDVRALTGVIANMPRGDGVAATQ